MDARAVLLTACAAFIWLTQVAPAAAAEACAPVQRGTYADTGPARAAFPDDPLFEVQENLQRISIPQVWSRGFLGEGAVVAIVDSGMDLDHPEFAGRLLQGVDTFEQLPGKVDCPPGPAGEQDAHGTGVAGIAVAAADNGIGLAGVAPRALIIPVRAFDDVEGGESPQAMAAGIRFAADHGADVVNASFTAGVTGLDRAELILNRNGIALPERDLAALEDAVAYAWERGTIVVAAAGNTEPGIPQATDTPLCATPARFPNVVCVTATEIDGKPSPFSHLAVREDGGVSVAAPGFRRSPLVDCRSIVSTWPGTMPYANPNPLHGADCGTLPRGYTWRSFTSTATPQVTGLVALMRAAGIPPAEVLRRLRERSSNRGGWDPATGHGIVDGEAALADTAPPAPCPVSRKRITVRLRKGERVQRVVRASVDGRPASARLRGRGRVVVLLEGLAPGDHLVSLRLRVSGGRRLALGRRLELC